MAMIRWNAAPLVAPILALAAAAAAAGPGTVPTTSSAAATRTTEPFAVVLIDNKTEKALGPFPYDRSVYARAIDKAAASGARGVVLKFFIDLPKTEAGDRALAEAIGRTKVILQAHLDDAEAAPNALPKRFRTQLAGGADKGKILTGNSGLIPLPQLSEKAYDVGFIDYTTIDRAPMVERYKGDYVKSLYTCCLELALGEPARVVPGKAIEIGGRALPLDAQGQAGVRYPTADELQYLSMIDLLEGPPRAELRDKVVILGFDGKAVDPVQTPAGPIGPHRVFCYALMSLYKQLK